jgi:hypothetical protein
MNFNKIYGNRFFEGEPSGGTAAVEIKPNGKDLPDEVKKQLERAEYLEAENKKLIAARDKAKEEKRKEEEEKLKEQGEFKKLLEAKEKEFEPLKQKAEAYDSYVQSEIDKAKSILGDKWDEAYAKLPLTSLSKMVSTFVAKNPDPRIDTGSNGSEIPKVILSAEQKYEAHKMFEGWDDEAAAEAAYAEVLEKRKKAKK